MLPLPQRITGKFGHIIAMLSATTPILEVHNKAKYNHIMAPKHIGFIYNVYDHLIKASNLVK